MNVEDILKRKLRKLIEKPRNGQLYNDIGVILYELKDYGNARNYLCRARELYSDNYDVLYNYANTLYALSEWNAASTAFIEYLDNKPNDKAAIEKIADVYYQLGEFDLAARYVCMLIQ